MPLAATENHARAASDERRQALCPALLPEQSRDQAGPVGGGPTTLGRGQARTGTIAAASRRLLPVPFPVRRPRGRATDSRNTNRMPLNLGVVGSLRATGRPVGRRPSLRRLQRRASARAGVRRDVTMSTCVAKPRRESIRSASFPPPAPASAVRHCGWIREPRVQAGQCRGLPGEVATCLTLTSPCLFDAQRDRGHAHASLAAGPLEPWKWNYDLGMSIVLVGTSIHGRHTHDVRISNFTTKYWRGSTI